MVPGVCGADWELGGGQLIIRCLNARRMPMNSRELREIKNVLTRIENMILEIIDMMRQKM